MPIKGEFGISSRSNYIINVHCQSLCLLFGFLKLLLHNFLKGILGTLSLSSYILEKYVCLLYLKVSYWI